MGFGYYIIMIYNIGIVGIAFAKQCDLAVWPHYLATEIPAPIAVVSWGLSVIDWLI